MSKTKAKSDGGEAFPRTDEEPFGGTISYVGMSVRDYYAGLIAASFAMSEADCLRLSTGTPPSYRLMAKHCFDFAQALVDEGEMRYQPIRDEELGRAKEELERAKEEVLERARNRVTG